MFSSVSLVGEGVIWGQKRWRSLCTLHFRSLKFVYFWRFDVQAIGKDGSGWDDGGVVISIIVERRSFW